MTPIDRAGRWLDKQDAAVSGAGGHAQTYHVACVLWQGFALGEHDVAALLAEFNSRCSPPWTDSELAHKVKSAASANHDKPKGYMLNNAPSASPAPRHGSFRPSAGSRPPQNAPAPASAPKFKPARVETPDSAELPPPLPDGSRALLLAAFNDGEAVRIAPAVLNEDGREIPDGSGIVLSRAEWLRKLDAVDGNPNRIFKSSERTGIYVTVNPMKLGGSKDADVTAFRHALIEFDNISPVEQFNLYAAARLPCAAIISSGGKSVHAWVRVDAQDRREYDDRTRILHAYFEAAGVQIDGKNKNPSRFSRLPNCIRFKARQELLAVNTGAESFTEWLKLVAQDDLGECETFASLNALDTANDPNCVIGFRMENDEAGQPFNKTLRYLCKGKAALLIGPAGIGKSSLNTEFAIGWALGRSVFGITPARPLKSLIVQGENDACDLAEMVQGITESHNLSFDDAALATVNRNVLFKTSTTLVGQAFIAWLHRLIDRERPDILWLDPLLSFFGLDVSKQSEVSVFLREWLQPVLEATGVVLIGIHHTGKPKSARETVNWTVLDFAYSGLGSSELVNWARAVMVLHPHGDCFELKLAKRGSRAGATNPDGSWAFNAVWLKHATGKIRWEQVEEPREEAREGKAKPKAKTVDDLMAHVPATGRIAKDVLLQKLTGAGFAKHAGRAILTEAIDAGQLHEFKVKRKGTNPKPYLSRLPEPLPEP